MFCNHSCGHDDQKQGALCTSMPASSMSTRMPGGRISMLLEEEVTAA